MLNKVKGHKIKWHIFHAIKRIYELHIINYTGPGLTHSQILQAVRRGMVNAIQHFIASSESTCDVIYSQLALHTINDSLFWSDPITNLQDTPQAIAHTENGKTHA